MAAAPQRTNPTKPQPRRDPPAEPAPAPAPRPNTPTELGWLPDCVYTGEKFETGVAFFADALGRITRFSREPADLAMARRLAGQAALPGLINGHSLSWQRALRGRMEQPTSGGLDPIAVWQDAADRLAGRLTPDDVFETARMAFTEMLLAGITCVGEFHELRNQSDGSASPEPNAFAHQVLRAAHEVGIRIALFNVAAMRSGHRQPAGTASPHVRMSTADAFVRETEQLRTDIAGKYPSDEVWLGVAPRSLAAVPLDQFKVIATYGHAQRMRVQSLVATRRDELDACVAEHGRGSVALLVDNGIADKRFTAVHGSYLSDEECRQLGAARATVCICPTSEHDLGIGTAPVEKLLGAGAAVALGTASQVQIDLLKDLRLLEYGMRASRGVRPAIAPQAAKALFHAATVAGARSLGATGGALEVGRPADFFTVNIYDPSIAGADPESLLASVVFALERRAIREVWIGARQRITNGRHLNQGLIVGKFVEAQRRLWGTG